MPGARTRGASASDQPCVVPSFVAVTMAHLKISFSEPISDVVIDSELGCAPKRAGLMVTAYDAM